MADDTLFPRTPAFGSLIRPAGDQANPGVTVQERVDLHLATVIARKGMAQALRDQVAHAFGIDLPDGPRRVANGPVAFMGTGPGTWLASTDAGPVDFRAALGASASVADQTDGYAVLRLSGPRLLNTLAKGIAIDLHPRVFGPGDSASTTAGHMGITLWQLDEAPTVEIALFRSLAGSFWHFLEASAAEYGLMPKS